MWKPPSKLFMFGLYDFLLINFVSDFIFCVFPTLFSHFLCSFHFFPNKNVHQIYLFFLSIGFWNWSKFAELLCMPNFSHEKKGGSRKTVKLSNLREHPANNSHSNFFCQFQIIQNCQEFLFILLYDFFSEYSLFSICFVNNRNCYHIKTISIDIFEHLLAALKLTNILWIPNIVWHKHFAIESIFTNLLVDVKIFCSFCHLTWICQSTVLLPLQCFLWHTVFMGLYTSNRLKLKM